MNRVIFALVFVLVAQSLPAEEIKDFGRDRLNSSPRHADWVDIKSGDRTIKAFVVYPESKNKTPVVLVVSEILGLTVWIGGFSADLGEKALMGLAPVFTTGKKLKNLYPVRNPLSLFRKEK